MDILTLLEATVKLGIPMVILSWVICTWLYGGVIAWLLIAYVGYWVGVELARRGDDLPIQGLLNKLRSLFPARQ
ncbi:MAG: hypothetical protein WDZ52_00445 [Pseudohongiellaceae bacterium]